MDPELEDVLRDLRRVDKEQEAAAHAALEALGVAVRWLGRIQYGGGAAGMLAECALEEIQTVLPGA